MASEKKKVSVQVFYRIVKAERGHPFCGLYAVEKVFYKGDELMKREIVHEWDLRIISESILAKLGGSDAYETFKLEHEVAELEKNIAEVPARTKDEIMALPKSKLRDEQAGKE